MYEIREYDEKDKEQVVELWTNICRFYNISCGGKKKIKK